ncbi:MAG: sigma-70 family RNA polymerase sigma factor [Planctomycetaceae bacterium]|nr:sigma-70 family RNA polymerase sigma factor [Planctomycetaceae bacterium]
MSLTPAATSQYNEDDLRMIRLQEGDPGAFDEIVAVWSRPLFGFFRRSSRDEQLCEDLVQETLLRLYRKGWDYLPTGRFRGWLFRIANNLMIDHARRAVNDVMIRSLRQSVKSGDDEFDLLKTIPSDLLPPDSRAETSEIAVVVRELLEELPEDQRSTFELHHYESLTLSEVADAMETSLPTAKSRLRLAKEKLRYLLSCRGFAESE